MMRTKKRIVVQDLHAMMTYRLFKKNRWLADRETCHALGRKFYKLGLHHRSDDGRTTWPTSLGHELQVNLMKVFVGLTDEYDMIIELENHGLITKTQFLNGRCAMRNCCPSHACRCRFCPWKRF